MACRSVLVVLALALATARPVRAEKVGLLFGSFGDVESCGCVEAFMKNSLARLVEYEIPQPSSLKPLSADIIWHFSKNETYAMYKAISPECNTTFQLRAREQAAAVAAVVRELRPKDAVSEFVGFNFVSGTGCPAGVTVADQTRRAVQAGVDKLVLVNQNGAQSSNSSIGVSYEDAVKTLQALARTDDYNVSLTAIGIDDYSQTPQFEQLLIAHTDAALRSPKNSFAGAPPADVCIVFACHGNPESLTRHGDPYEAQIRKNFASLRTHYLALGYANVSLAWQNHGGKGTPWPNSYFPWASPPDTDVMPALNAAPCPNVLVTGAVSFVLDMSETEFDEHIDDKRMLPAKRLFVPPVFNADPAFARYLGGVVSNAIDMKGSMRVLYPEISQ